MIDGSDLESFTSDVDTIDALELSEIIKGYCEEIITSYSHENTFAQSYALAFLSDVNFYEIAEHLIEDTREEEETE